MKHKLLLSLIPVLFITGCSLPKYKDDSKFHQISANTNGNYLSLYDGNDNFQCGLNEHLDNITEKLEQHPVSESGKKKVLVSIHGGLNGVKDNYKRVHKHYEDAIDDEHYPIFLGWRSGALTTLKDRYFGVRNGVDRPLWVTVPSFPFYLGSDLLRGVAAVPESLWDQSANFATTHIKRIRDFDEEDIQKVQSDFETIDFYYTGRGDEKSFWQQVGYATRQVIPGVLRIVSTPLIEGAANKSWEVMLRRAKTLMYRQGDLAYRGIGRAHLSENPVPSKCELESKYFKWGEPNGVAAQLMRAIESLGDEFEIVLVGHSMGAIIANDIVKEFPGANYSTIVHMASADSIRNLIEKTVPVLEKEDSSVNFFNLTLHPTNEEQEQSAFGIAPEGSLLIWIDYILSNPETTLDRRAGRWENIKWAFPLFENNDNMKFKMFGLRQSKEYSSEYKTATNAHAKNDEPIIHGDFGDYKYWREEFYWGKP